MFKVGIIGAESTGKSTLAAELAEQFHGLLVPEYARAYVERKGSTEVTWEELCAIARHQIEEMAALNAQPSVYCDQPSAAGHEPVVFFDTELIVTKVWFEYAFGRVPEWLEEAIGRYPMDICLLTFPDIEWVPDPARSNGSDAVRMELTERYEAEIKALDIPYFVIRHS